MNNSDTVHVGTILKKLPIVVMKFMSSSTLSNLFLESYKKLATSTQSYELSDMFFLTVKFQKKLRFKLDLCNQGYWLWTKTLGSTEPAWMFWMLIFVSDISNFVNPLDKVDWVTSFITEMIYFWVTIFSINFSVTTGVSFLFYYISY